MVEGHTVIDVDAHYLEAVEQLAEYMDEPWATRVKAGGATWLLPRSLGDRHVAGRVQRDAEESYGWGQCSTPEEIAQVMGRLGIDASVMVSNRLALIGNLSVRDLAIAFCNACIDFMLDRKSVV